MNFDHGGTRRSGNVGIASELGTWKQDAWEHELLSIKKRVQMTQFCDDGWGNFTPPCREYSSSRAYPKTRALAAVPVGTIIGPAIEVHIVKILDEYGIEVAIPSICRPKDTSYVVISSETERFVNEIHKHNAEVR